MLAAQASGLPTREAQSVAYAELTLWSLLLGDGPAAAAMATKAVASMTPVTAGGVALARYLASPPLSVDAWRARVEQFFPDAGGVSGSGAAARDVALSYALELSGQFAPAVGVLRRVYERAGGLPESSAAVELGWALAETGAAQEAAALLRNNPTPSPNGPNPLLSLWFPEMFRARAAAAEKLGKGEEARANQALFDKLRQ
jgi:hypothetical protein